MGDGQLRTQIMYKGQTSAYATAAVVDTNIGIVKGFDPTNSKNNELIYGAGDGRNPVKIVYGNYDSGGTLRWEVATFDFLKHWIGFVDGAGSVGDPYKVNEVEVGSLSTSEGLQAFTLGVNHLNGAAEDVDTYTGCVGAAFSLSGRIGGRVEASGQIVARNPVSGTSGQTYSANTTEPWICVQGTWKWGATPSAVTGVQSFTVNYVNNLIVTRDLDDRFIKQPVLGVRRYDFSLVVKMESAIATTLRDDFYGQANSPIDGALGAVATGNEFKIELTDGTNNAYIWLDDCAINTISKPVDVEGGQMVLLTIDGSATKGKGAAPIAWWT